MNKILKEIKEIMIDCIEKHLPEISFKDLEDNGAVFYMNGKNGTEFDWYVNNKLSDFMIFYNDENNIVVLPNPNKRKNRRAAPVC